MNDLTIFQNPEFGAIRSLVLDDEPWFVGKDVAMALGYGKGKSPINAVANHVDADDKGVTEMMTPGGKQQIVIINESGLYSLIMGSKLESAKRFKHWVTSEVLPQIRKTGRYAPAQAANPISTDDYIRAAGIVARCTDQRLPIVLNLLEKGGFSMQRLNGFCGEAPDNSEKITSEDLAHLQAVLGDYTVRQAARLVNLSPGIISYYRRGLRSPDYERYKRMLEILE